MSGCDILHSPVFLPSGLYIAVFLSMKVSPFNNAHFRINGHGS